MRTSDSRIKIKRKLHYCGAALNISEEEEKLSSVGSPELKFNDLKNQT